MPLTPRNPVKCTSFTRNPCVLIHQLTLVTTALLTSKLCLRSFPVSKLSSFINVSEWPCFQALGHFPALSSRMAWRPFFRGGVVLLLGKTDTAQRLNLTPKQLRTNAGWSTLKCLTASLWLCPFKGIKNFRVFS